MTTPAGARHRLVELTRAEVSRRAPDALAVVPVGACEQHGPHLPLGTDLMVVEHIADQVAGRLEGDVDVVVAPPAAVGFSPHHVPVGPTLTAEVSTLSALLTDTCRGLVASGFRRLFLLNGHGGNAELLVVIARSVGQDLRVRTGAGSYWVMAWDELVAAGAQQRGRLPGHAGAFETSLALALRPDLVVDPPHRPGAFAANPAGYFGRFHTEDVTTWESGDGYSDDPSAGDAEAGRRYLEVVVDRVADGLRAFASG